MDSGEEHSKPVLHERQKQDSPTCGASFDALQRFGTFGAKFVPPAQPTGSAQRFLAVFSVISPRFRPRRHRLTADDYRTEMADRFATWNDITRSAEAA